MARAKNSSEAKHCGTCAEPIQAAAKKCIHCDSYQDWRKLIPTSANVLALLVALIAVLGSTAPILKQVFYEPEANILFTYQDGSYRSVSILFSNEGEKSGSLSNGAIRLPSGERLFLKRPGRSDVILLSAGQTAVADFISFGNVKNLPKNDEQCYIQFFQVAPNKPERLLESGIKCGLLRWLWMNPK